MGEIKREAPLSMFPSLSCWLHKCLSRNSSCKCLRQVLPNLPATMTPSFFWSWLQKKTQQNNVKSAVQIFSTVMLQSCCQAACPVCIPQCPWGCTVWKTTLKAHTSLEPALCQGGGGRIDAKYSLCACLEALSR